MGEYIVSLFSTIDDALDTRRKRHIIGGILISASLLFGSLAITVISIKTEDNKYE